MRGLAGSGAAKVKHLFGLCKDFGRKMCKVSAKSKFTCFFAEPQPILCKSDDLAGVFNSCWVLGRAKCGVYKPKWVDYKPYWGMWKDGTNFVASLCTSGRRDCEVVAGIYEVGLHGKRRGATFVASMSAGRTYWYSLSIIHYSFFSCLCMMRAC